MFRNTVPVIFIAMIFGSLVPHSLGDIITFGASQDNTMFEANQTNSNGAGSFFFAGRTSIQSGFTLHRGLLAFDIAGNIPEGATIDVVSLSLHLSRSRPGSTSTVTLHSVNQAWGEAGSNSDNNFPGPGGGSPAQPGDATWQNTFFPGNTWTDLGGDFNLTASAAQTVGSVPGSFTWSSAAMVADVQDWLDNPGGNFGWAILGDESGIGGTSKRFDSRENSNPPFQPMLTVTFTPNAQDVVAPDSFLVTRGCYVSGGVAELAESDNVDLSLRRSNTDLQSRTEFEVKGISPTAAPTSFQFTLEGSVFARGNVVQTIELFDYDLAVWELVDTSDSNRAPMPDKVVTATPAGDLSRFVEAGTMCIEARIRYKSDRNRQKFASNTDQAIWTIGQ